MAFVLNKLKVAGLEAASVIDKVIVSAFPESSETIIDLINAYVLAGTV